MYVCSKQGNPCERLQGSAFENPITHWDDQRTKARTGRVSHKVAYANPMQTLTLAITLTLRLGLGFGLRLGLAYAKHMQP